MMVNNMADDENQLHEIFTIDPDHLKSYVDHYVEVHLKDGMKITGVVYTIDPVSHSYILITKERELLSVKIVLKHSIKSVSVISDVPEDYKTLDSSDVFRTRFNETTVNEMKIIKEKVKTWLLKNMIPVEEKGDLLILDTLEIHPPYNAESCFSSNLIVLDRIQNLLKNMNVKT